MVLIYKMRNFVIKNARILKKIDIPSKKQQDILNSFEKPSDIVERSYFQYKATMHEWTFFGRVLAETVAFLMFYFYANRLLKIDVAFQEPMDMVCFVASDQKDIVPQQLKNEFSKCYFSDTTALMCLDKEDWNYLINITRRFKYSYYFKLKILLRVASYSANIKRFQPKAFVSAAEHSFANTLCTDYCNRMGLENIVCQHGEYLKRLKGAFFYVHRYYAWDNYYIELHRQYKAYIPCYFIQLPASITNLGVMVSDKPQYFATYYLGYEGEQKLLQIRIVFDELKKQGKECKIRLHPRGRKSNEKIVRNVFAGYYIEDCSNVPLGLSMSESEYLMSVCSTVLLQGYFNNKKIILDNLTDPALFEKMKDWGYVMLSKKHVLLSELIKESRDVC